MHASRLTSSQTIRNIRVGPPRLTSIYARRNIPERNSKETVVFGESPFVSIFQRTVTSAGPSKRFGRFEGLFANGITPNVGPQKGDSSLDKTRRESRLFGLSLSLSRARRSSKLLALRTFLSKSRAVERGRDERVRETRKGRRCAPASLEGRFEKNADRNR